MSMSKRDYEAIALIIWRQRALAEADRVRWAEQGGAELWRLDETTRALADHFAEGNPRFDRERFLTACGIDQATEADDRLRDFIVTSDWAGEAVERTWQAEDADHAREQHLDAFPDEPITGVTA